MKSYDLVVNEYKTNPLYRNMRLGQYFVFCYIKHEWPELYYADDRLAESVIKTWLSGMQYYNELPPIVKKDNPIKVEFGEKYE